MMGFRTGCPQICHFGILMNFELKSFKKQLVREEHSALALCPWKQDSSAMWKGPFLLQQVKQHRCHQREGAQGQGRLTNLLPKPKLLCLQFFTNLLFHCLKDTGTVWFGHFLRVSYFVSCVTLIIRPAKQPTRKEGKSFPPTPDIRGVESLRSRPSKGGGMSGMLQGWASMKLCPSLQKPASLCRPPALPSHNGEEIFCTNILQSWKRPLQHLH